MRKQILSRTLAAASLALACVVAPLARAQAPAKPVAVVAFSGYDELLKDVNFLGGLAGQPNASQSIEGMLMMFTQGKGLVGLDKTQPIGFVAQHDGTMPSGALVLPVTDLNQLLELTKGFGVTSSDAGNGVTQIQAQGNNLFAKTSGKWALISIAPAMLDAMPADPGALLTPLTKTYDLAVSVNVQNVPPEMRQQAVEMMSQGAQSNLHKLPEETDAAFADRQKMVQQQIDAFKKFLAELDKFTVGLAVDGPGKKAYLDMYYSAVEGSDLGKAIANAENSTTNFAGFQKPGSAMSLTFASKMTDDQTAQVEQMLAGVREKVNAAVDSEKGIKSDESRAEIKGGAGDFLDAITATLKEGVCDGGAVLDVKPDALNFVAGGLIADPAKVEAGVKKIFAAAKRDNPEVPEAKWDAETYKGVTFHVADHPVPADKPAARALFGESAKVVVGIGEKSVYFGFGRDAVGAIKEVVDASAASPAKSTEPMNLTVTLTPIVEAAAKLAEPAKKPMFEAIASMLKGEGANADHLRITTQAADGGVRTRIETEEGALRSIALAGMMSQGPPPGGPPADAIPAPQR